MPQRLEITWRDIALGALTVLSAIGAGYARQMAVDVRELREQGEQTRKAIAGNRGDLSGLEIKIDALQATIDDRRDGIRREIEALREDVKENREMLREGR